MLQDQNESVHYRAEETLTKVGKDAVSTLIQALRDQHTQVRKGATSILRNIGEEGVSADDAVVEREREISQMARLLGREEDAATFDRMAKDELDHVEKYKQALELLQKQVPD